ncbi:MAG TPA: hypothetical protein VMU01_11560 [Rhizomicrobium sp.]|nr:hypothetical protein [Rhizomicrobium sp.]
MIPNLANAAQAANILYDFGFLVGGAWVLYTYRRSVRSSAARWSLDLFRHFYNHTGFEKPRQMIEYDFDERVRFLIQRRVTDRNLPLSQEEKRELQQLDNLLNYLEAVMYIVDNRQLLGSDADAFFDYWFSLIKTDDHAILRRYLRMGYERLARRVGVASHDFLFLPDNLKRRAADEVRALGLRASPLGYAAAAEREGDAVTPGTLYRIARGGELKAVRRLDAAMGYAAKDDARSPVRRRMIRVYPNNAQRSGGAKGVDAWVYWE